MRQVYRESVQDSWFGRVLIWALDESAVVKWDSESLAAHSKVQ